LLGVWLNPARPFFAVRPWAVREFGSLNAVSSTASPDEDNQPGAKGASTNDIKHQQAALSQHCP
jgi:hypothetical protein